LFDFSSGLSSNSPFQVMDPPVFFQSATLTLPFEAIGQSDNFLPPSSPPLLSRHRPLFFSLSTWNDEEHSSHAHEGWRTPLFILFLLSLSRLPLKLTFPALIEGVEKLMAEPPFTQSAGRRVPPFPPKLNHHFSVDSRQVFFFEECPVSSERFPPLGWYLAASSNWD